MKDAPASPVAPVPATLRELYCGFHGCRPDEFERNLFRRAMRTPWGWLTPLLLRLWSLSFRRDFRELTAAGHALSPGELTSLANEFRDNPREARTFLRDTFGVRVSGRKLLAEAERVWQASLASR